MKCDYRCEEKTIYCKGFCPETKNTHHLYVSHSRLKQVRHADLLKAYPNCIGFHANRKPH